MLSKIVRTRRTLDREKLPCISIGDYIVTLLFCSNSIPITIISSALVQILEIHICQLKEWRYKSYNFQSHDETFACIFPGCLVHQHGRWNQ